MKNAIDYVSTAMVAWDEIWQGYPDHWIKVHGNLLTAYENCNNEVIEEEILEEIHKFMSGYENKKMYRPKFEKIACDLLNLSTGKNIVPRGYSLDSQLCYDCAIKHLSEASESFKQIETNPKAWIHIIGNLSHAANHLVENHPKFANEIRNIRKNFMDNLMIGKLTKFDITKICERTRKLAEQNLYDMEMDEK